MTGWLEVVAVAFVAQLAVLPGEKVQFIIAGLSTRYDPRVVVAAAGSAFAGWTAVEIAFGGAIEGIVPAVYLDAATAVLFVVFAVMLVRSAPGSTPAETDGGVGATADGELDVTVFGREVPDGFGGFLPIFALMAFGEFGDKTQLVTISLALQYGAHPGIWAGEMLAIVPVSLANAYFFHRFVGRIDLRRAHFAAAALFAFFALDTVLGIVAGVSLWGTAVSAVSNAVLAAA